MTYLTVNMVAGQEKRYQYAEKMRDNKINYILFY
jgi:hypothetical protein